MNDEMNEMPEEVWISHRSRIAYTGGMKESAKGVRYTRSDLPRELPGEVKEAAKRLRDDVAHVDRAQEEIYYIEVDEMAADLRTLLNHLDPPKEQSPNAND